MVIKFALQIRVKPLNKRMNRDKYIWDRRGHRTKGKRGKWKTSNINAWKLRIIPQNGAKMTRCAELQTAKLHDRYGKKPNIPQVVKKE